MEYNDNIEQGARAFVKNLLFQRIPEKHKDAYDGFRNGQNAQRLPYFYLLMALHRVSSIIVYFVLYPVMFSVQTMPSASTYIIYSVFYFIFLALASFATKKFRFLFEREPKILNYMYIFAFAILIVDDFVTTEFFYGIFNPIRFLGGVMLISTLPIFTKRTAKLMVVIYLVATIMAKVVFEYPMDVYTVSSVYSVILTFVAMIVSAFIKTNHLNYFLESQRVAEQKETLMQLSTTDALTKISNRRAFDEYIAKVWAEARKKGQSVSVMMMDVDRFKLFNDNFGHVEGDKCLISIADTISAKFQRRGDMFARFGGEEFVAVVANEPGDDILKFAESIRESVEELKISNPLNIQNPYITLSVGLASRIPTGDNDPYSIIELADAALYAAKQSGRNRVVTDFLDADGQSSKMENDQQKTEVTGIREDFARISTIMRVNMLSSFSMDLNSGMMEFGPESARRLGLANEGVAMSYADFIEHTHKEDWERLHVFFKNMIDAAVENDVSDKKFVVFRLPLNEGDHIWVSLKVITSEDIERYEMERDERYNLSENMVLGVITDFTEQIRAQKISVLAAEGASDYTFSYNFKTDMITVNDNFARDFVLNSASFTNALETILEFMPRKSDKNDFLEAMRKIETNSTDRAEFKMHVYNKYMKSMQWLLVKGKSTKDEHGKPEMMAGVVDDITQQMRNEELNNLIIEGSADCVFIFDMERNVFEFSSKIYDLVSTKTRTMNNGLETWLEYIIPADRHAFTSALESVLYGETEIFKTEFRLKGKKDAPFWVALSGKCSLDEGGAPVLIAGSLINLDSMRQFSSYLDEIRNVDKLSGLPNRVAFNYDFNAASAVMSEISAFGLEEGMDKGYIVMVDIDDFGNINSIHGLSVGDRLLTEYGALLTLLVPPENKLYHFESNRFVIYVQSDTFENTESLCAQIHMFSSNGLLVDESYVEMTVSIGAAEFGSKDTVDDVLTNAELALRKAKMTKNSMNFFTPKDKEEHFARLRLEAEIRECVLDDFRGFEVFYQPLFSTSLNMFIGGEALLRWRDANGKIVSPGIVIPTLQNIGMFPEVEGWIFRSAAKQCAQWIRMTGFEDLVINVNMSPTRAAKSGLAEETLAVMDSEGLSKENIFLELTEESVVQEGSYTRASTLKELQEHGIRLAIDDFGTGYSSLGYLRDLPVCELKIDRAFVADIETNKNNRDFVAAIINLCHIMDYIVCVEGVERLEQARILMDMDADLLQGFYFSPPVSSEVFEDKFLKNLMDEDKFVRDYGEIREINIGEMVS
ncbi:MAG: bifunctional diguanylate cyclase/phosphodiesterase [Defluviitaleaceae bacterium]|nr:bifunctional diguanylate cyclase/phosphodiesterase [Defluviitaleaceae bacterium]